MTLYRIDILLMWLQKSEDGSRNVGNPTKQIKAVLGQPSKPVLQMSFKTIHAVIRAYTPNMPPQPFQ